MHICTFVSRCDRTNNIGGITGDSKKIYPSEVHPVPDGEMKVFCQISGSIK